MKKILFLFLAIFLFSNTSLNAQTNKKKKKKTTKTTKKKKKTEKSTFIYENEKSGNYKKVDRAEISKPQMPMYSVDQTFQKGNKKKTQQKAFNEKKYFFPSKPNNAWQIGVFGGFSTLVSDITPNIFYSNSPALPGHNFGVHVTKSWSYLFSTRLKYSQMVMFTNDAVASTLTSNQLNGINRYNDVKLDGPGKYHAGQQFFHNSRTQAHDMNFDFIVTIGNLKFHKERTNVVFKIFPSIGMLMYQTFNDHLDANGDKYDYESIANLNLLGVKDRGAIIKQLSSIRDGKYETRAEENTVNDENKFLGYNTSFVFGIGTGVTFRLFDWMYLDIETRQMLTTDDLIDGMQWEEPLAVSSLPVSRGLTANFDTYNQTTVGLTFNLIGKNTTEPLSMLNPMHYSYQKIAEVDPQTAIDDLLKDDDNDGVPNRLDQEDNTPEGANVDPKGMAIDSDKDGIIDFNDEEPFSIPGYPVDGKGVAIGTDAELKEKVKAIVEDMKLNGGASGTGSGFNCSTLPVELPSIHFDKDKYILKPEFYSSLYEVAQRMLMCPSVKVLAVGNADVDHNVKYNEQLSYNRVKAAIDFIVEKYGVDRNRFIYNFKGESLAVFPSQTKQQYNDRKVSFKIVVNETGSNQLIEPHPGLKAGQGK